MHWSTDALALIMVCSRTPCPVGSRDFRLSDPNRVLLPAARMIPIIIGLMARLARVMYLLCRFAMAESFDQATCWLLKSAFSCTLCSLLSAVSWANIAIAISAGVLLPIGKPTGA